MNQILIAEKVYITPELKRKKRMYKIDFFISVILVFILSSYYIYAEYDKNKSEEKSQEILSSLSFNSSLVDDTTIKFEDNATLVLLNEKSEPVVISTTEDDDASKEEEINSIVEDTIKRNTYRTESGQEYWPIATINIPSINCNYPILNTCTDELLKLSPCYFHGAQPNEVGNFCIAGHNYRTNKFFSKVPTLQIGDIIEIEDLRKNTVKYAVYDKYTVEVDDVSCTSQKTNGKTEITLITCTNDSEKRVIVKARKVGE